MYIDYFKRYGCNVTISLSIFCILTYLKFLYHKRIQMPHKLFFDILKELSLKCLHIHVESSI